MPDQQLTPNFRRSEWEKAGHPVPKRYQANVQACADSLQVLRDFTGAPITITPHGGYRPPELNRQVGGVKRSLHLTAKAADIKVKGWKPAEVADVIRRLIRAGCMSQGGVGVYSTFVHYDVRGRPARWRG